MIVPCSSTILNLLYLETWDAFQLGYDRILQQFAMPRESVFTCSLQFQKPFSFPFKNVAFESGDFLSGAPERPSTLWPRIGGEPLLHLRNELPPEYQALRRRPFMVGSGVRDGCRVHLPSSPAKLNSLTLATSLAPSVAILQNGNIVHQQVPAKRSNNFKHSGLTLCYERRRVQGQPPANNHFGLRGDFR